MDANKNVLTSFRNAGKEVRIDMYMNHRDLRPLFDQIEANEKSLRVSKVIRGGERIIPIYLQRFLRGHCVMFTKA